MLSKKYKEHSQKSAAREIETDALTQRTLSTAAKVSVSLGTHLNAEASQIYDNQKEIEKETRKYLKTLEELKAQSSRWIELSNEFNSALKELGNIKDWATYVDKEVDKIVSSATK